MTSFFFFSLSSKRLCLSNKELRNRMKSSELYLLKTFCFSLFSFVEGLKLLKRSYRHEFMRDKSCFMDQKTGISKKADNKQTFRVLIIRRNCYEKTFRKSYKRIFRTTSLKKLSSFSNCAANLKIEL